MIDVVAAVNDEDVLAANLLRSPMLARDDVRFHARRGFHSASRAYDDALSDCTADIVVFAHQDVYLPEGWQAQLMAQVAQVAQRDPEWGVLGVYGVTAQGRHAGCVWNSGLQRVLGAPFEQPVPVQSVDEALVVLRRHSGLNFDPKMPGYHLYAADLVQSALDRGLGAYVVSAPVVHNSRRARLLREDYFEADRYLAHKWFDRLPIRATPAPVLPWGPRWLALRAAHRVMSWTRPAVAHPPRPLDCVAIARQLNFE